jgi:hypothetical protein
MVYMCICIHYRIVVSSALSIATILAGFCFCSCLLHPTQPFNQLPASSHQKARI